MHCLNCSKPIHSNDFSFKAIEIQTFAVRDLKGESKIQALGKTVTFHVCKDCAEKQYKNDSEFKVLNIPTAKNYIYLTVCGLLIVLLSLVLIKHSLLTMLGAMAIIAGSLGSYEAIKKALVLSKELKTMSEDDRLESSAWRVVLNNAPTKDGDNDITYIPINNKTKEYKPGDIMVLYNLLPELAIEAHKRINDEI